MPATDRRPGSSPRRWTAGLAFGTLLLGLLAVANVAMAEDDVVEGGVYGWGVTGSGTNAEAWELEFDNSEAPFVDVVALRGGGDDYTVLAVSEAGNIVTAGPDTYGVISDIPAELAEEQVVSLGLFYLTRGAAVGAVTADGDLFTWGLAPPVEQPNQFCDQRVAEHGAVDVTFSLGSSTSSDTGMVLLGDGSVCTWAQDQGGQNVVANTPDVDNAAKIGSTNGGAYWIITDEGDLIQWRGSSAHPDRVTEEMEATTIVDATLQGNGTLWALTDEGEVLLGGSTTRPFPEDHGGAIGTIIGLGTLSSQAQHSMSAVTDHGEFITWGFSGTQEPYYSLMTTAPDHLTGYEVTAMATLNGRGVIAVLGEDLDLELDPLTVAEQPSIGLEDGADEARIGVTIEATPAVFEPASGLSVEHRWFRDGDLIEGADGSSYTLTTDDLDASISYQTYAFRAADEDEATSDITEAIGPVLPAALAFTEETTIDGSGYIDTEHTVVAAETNYDDDVTHTFEWTVSFEDERPDVTAPGESFTPDEDHAGGMITVTQTAEREDESASQTSDPVGPVAEDPGPVGIESDPVIEVENGQELIGDPKFAGEDVLVGTPAVFSETEGITVENFFVILNTGEELPAELDADGLARLELASEHVGVLIAFRSVATREGHEDAPTVVDTGFVSGIFERLLAESDPVIGGDQPWEGEQLTIAAQAQFNHGPPEIGPPVHRWIAIDENGDEEQLGANNDTTLTLSEEHLGLTIVLEAEASRAVTDEVVTARSEEVGPVVAPPEPVDFDGSPSISSDTDEIEVGAVLTAQAASFTGDIEGDPVHEWLIDGEVVATGESFDLLAEHGGETIGLRTRVVELLTGDEVVSEVAEVGPVLAAPLAVDGLPVILGNPWIGQELSVTAAAVNDDEADVSFQWLADGTEIEGATGETWDVTAEYEDALISVVQIASRDGATEPGRDYAESEPSEPTAPVREAPVDLTVVDEADIEGPRLVGQTLLGTPAVFTDESDEVVVTSYWVIDGEAVEADVSNELELTSEHVGADIQFRSVIEREIDEATMASTSETVIGPVLAQLAVDTEASISGDAEVGATLTATPAVFNDPDATVTHTWLVDGDPVDHEGLTFELTDEHEGQVIGFRSEATRVVDGIEESDSSEAFSGEVALPDDNGGDGGSPTPPPGDDDEALRCLAVTPDTVSAGSAHEISVDLSDCGDWAGHEVSIWLFSNPVDLGTVTVGADGTFTVTIPAGVPAGAHQLAVYDAEGNLIGYADLTITGDGAGGPGGSGSGLPATGYEGSPAGLLLAVLLILTGGIAVVAARMRRGLRI